MKQKILDITLIVGLLIITAMALLPLLGMDGEWLRWLFAAGALMVLVVRVLERYPGDNLRIQRLYRINLISALMLCASAVMFWYKGQTEWSRNWVAFLMAGAVLLIYVSFAIDHEHRRMARKGGDD